MFNRAERIPARRLYGASDRVGSCFLFTQTAYIIALFEQSIMNRVMTIMTIKVNGMTIISNTYCEWVGAFHPSGVLPIFFLSTRVLPNDTLLIIISERDFSSWEYAAVEIKLIGICTESE